MNYDEMQTLAIQHNLGAIHWQSKIASNTGNVMEVGYVFVDDEKLLFCKKGYLNDSFYLCNEFRTLKEG